MSLWRRKSAELKASASRVAERSTHLKANAHRFAHRMLERLLSIFLSPVRAFKVLCFSIGFVFLVSLGVFGISVYSFVKALPQIGQLKFRDLKMIAQGKVYDKLEADRKYYRWISLEDVSREYLYAIVISEDASFFEHSGFNFEAIANSLAENIREQKMAYGGSTISQQVVKNLFLTTEKTVTRKLKELLITRALESRFTKNEILEIYLNIAELGPEIFGVNAAASAYFKKTAKAINAAEGAFIALMLPSPKRHFYTIFQNKNLTRVKKKKIERVLRDMLYEEYLTESQYRNYTRYNYFGPMIRLPAARP